MRLLLLALLFATPLSALTYSVGPGQTYTSIGAVPWESIGAGDVVEIHWRATPYAEKWVICKQGTQANPIIVRGIPNGTTGALPVITGQNATTRTQLSYWNENRSLIKIGGASTPADTTPQYITIENLELRGAYAGYTYTNTAGTPGQAYIGNASAIYIEKGKHITIRGCTVTDCGNGIFVAPGGGTANPSSMSEYITISGNYIHGNGNSGSIYEHNTYCEANFITYEFNRYGALRSGAGGNNLKDRSANCVVRYNWIFSGNRQLDLTEADGSGINTLPGYDATYVYGNVLYEDQSGNSQIIHYGGDNGTSSTYRKGTLYLYNNTIYSTRSANTTLVRLSTNAETCDCRNNIIFVTASASNLGLIDDTGVLNYRNCFFKGTPTPSHSGAGMAGTVNNQGGNVTGADPGWTNVGSQDFTLTATAACRDTGTSLHASVLPTHNVSLEYVPHQQQQARASDATFDIGGFEFGSGGAPVPPTAPTTLVATATGALGADLSWTDTSSSETGFRIERRQGAGSYATAGTVAANVTVFSDSGLTNGLSYTYRVFAFNGGGDSTASNEDTIVAGSTPAAPAAPTGATAVAQAGLVIRVSWTDASSNEDGFYLERSDAGGAFNQIQTLGAGVTSFDDSGLTEGTLYAYRVRAYNTTGNSAYSNTASASASQGSSGGGGSGKSGGGGGCSAVGSAGVWMLALPLLFRRKRR